MLGAYIAAALALAVHCTSGTPTGSALPSWSPSGDALAFTVPQEESAAIELARPGAASPTSAWLSLDSAPVELAWSPRGDRIAFQKRTGAIEVLALGRGSFSRELVHAEYGTTTELGDWSPDGRQLVFARDGRIYTLDVGTGEIHDLVDGDHPTWSPDGLEIAYAVGDKLHGISPSGGTAREVATADTPIDAIAWSPDSTRLAFLGVAIGIVTRFAGQPVYTAPAEPPIVWRPNGIFYSLEEAALVGTRIWRLDPDAGTESPVTHLPPGYDAHFLDAARDGLRVAYGLDFRDQPVGLRAVDGDGRHDQPVLACRATKKPDLVRGTRLNDVIRVNGGGRDRVTCGAGRDIVYADRRDRIARDCETVRRSP